MSFWCHTCEQTVDRICEHEMPNERNCGNFRRFYERQKAHAEHLSEMEAEGEI